METAMAAAAGEAVQTPTSADDSRTPSSKIFLVPRTGDQPETSSQRGDATGISLPPLRQLTRNVVLPHVVLPTNQSSARDYIMKPRDESPGLSSSDVLMTSFNVLEDGDPVHRYQLQEEGTPAELQHTEYPSGPVTSTSWSDRGLEHNSNSILRALREPQDRQQPSWKSTGMQAMYSTSDRQRPIDTVVTSQGVLRWNDYNQNKEPVYQEYSVHDMSRENMATQQKISERLPQPQPSPSPEGTLTRAVKETFCIAHFSCTHCHEKFRVPEKLAEHVKTVHSGSIVYTCFTCGKKFYNSYDLREHVASHANDPIKCSLCDLTLSSSKELRNHHKKCHPMSVISCPLCEKIFATVSARTKHLAVEHQNDNRLKVCDLCGDAFVDKTAYEEHLKNHPKTTEENLASAVKRQPDVSEPPATVIIWKCDKCGIIFPDDKALGTHKDTEHQDDFTKPPVAQHLRNISQERLQLKQTPTDSRYELLRLLLARRMAASSKTAPTTSAPQVQTSTVSEVSSIANVLSPDIPMPSQGEGGQLNRPSAQEPPSHGRGPGILSAEAMQHVADELSMLEQSMDSKRKQVDQFLSMRSLPMTADMMIDSESTIGINYALKKNSTQDMKFKEIHKQKTLVNMLQGTVASIIEKEVKHNKISSKIQYHMPAQVPQQKKDSNHSDNASYSMSGYSARDVHVKQSEKEMENNNMIYENRNLGTGHPSQNQSGIHHRTSANMLSPLDLQKTYPYVTTSAGTFPQSSVLSTIPTMHSESDSFELQQKEGSNKYSNKCTSPWDNHIAPLLKLFQNVSSPPSDKVSPDDPFQKQKADDPNSQYLFPKESILDLSSSQPNTFDANHPLTLTSGYSQHLPEVSKSVDFSRNQEIRTTSGNIIHGTNIQVKPNTPLPAFRDISWSRNKSSKNDPENIPVSIVDSVYASLTSLSQPHSDVNQMSGGQLHYTQSEEDAYYGQSGERYDSRLGGVQSNPTIMQTGNPDDLQQQQTFNYQGTPHHQQQLSPQEEFIHPTQQSPHENPQTYQHSSFLSEDQAHLGQNSQHLAEHQGTTYTTSPTGQPMGNSYATMTPVPLPSLMQDQQQMNEVHHQNHHHHHQNYSPLPQQSPSPQRQMQLQHQNYNSAPEYNKNEVSQQNDKLRPVNDTVTRAITEYLNNRNTVLAKRSIPEVPLVVRHKLLATMLNEGSGAEGSDGIQNNMGTEEIGKQFQLDATRVNGAHQHNHMGHHQSQMHSVMSPPSEREEASYAGLIASTNNVLYETPIHDTIHNETNAYGNCVISRSLSEPTPSIGMSMDRQMQRPLSQSDTSTIDSQLLNQMMLSEVPTSHVTLPQMPPPRKQSEPHWSLPPQGTTHYTEEPNGHHINYIPNQVSPHMNPAAIPVTVEEGYNDYMMAPHSFPLPNNNENTGTKQRRRRRMGPAIRKRKAFVITQKADDEYIMVDGCVNVTAPKRARTCAQLGCHTPSSPSAQPSQPRMRGRPPKNGSLTVRKGSYKKGKYPCPVCGKFYAWKNYLRIHIAKHDRKVVEKVDDGQGHAP